MISFANSGMLGLSDWENPYNDPIDQIFRYYNSISSLFEKDLSHSYYSSVGYYLLKRQYTKRITEYGFIFWELYAIEIYILEVEKVLSFYYDDLVEISMFRGPFENINTNCNETLKYDKIEKRFIEIYADLLKTKDFLEDKKRSFSIFPQSCIWGDENVNALKEFYRELAKANFIEDNGWTDFFGAFCMENIIPEVKPINLINYDQTSFSYLFSEIKSFFPNWIQNQYTDWVSNHFLFKGKKKNYKRTNEVLIYWTKKPIPHKDDIDRLVSKVKELIVR